MGPFIREFVLLPSLCRERAYDTPAESDQAAGTLKRMMSSTAFVRDLRDGEWSAVAARAAGQPDSKWRRLLVQWKKEGRALPFPAQLSLACKDDAAWSREAERSHKVHALCAVVGPPGYPEAPAKDPADLSISGVFDWPEWTGASASKFLERTVGGWTDILRQLIRVDRRLRLIDSFLSPKKERYARLGLVLECVAREAGGIEVEFHRWKKDMMGVGAGRGACADVSINEWRNRFQSEWNAGFRSARIKAKVVLWPRKRHDRYLLTKGLGLHLGNGFEVEVDERTTVSCLKSEDRDALHSECNPDAHLDSGVEQFRFGADS